MSSEPSDMPPTGSVSGQQIACRRCGACCRKGGPALHSDDRKVIEEGHLPLTALYTIRQGEPAWNNITRAFCFPEEDIVKIKSRPGSATCIFFKGADCSCGIYNYRPIECRVLKCWDIKEIVDIYKRRRLSRKDLLENKQGLWELVAAHQAVCGYDSIRQLVRENDRNSLEYLIRYDLSYRNLVVEKGLLNAAVLDFFFGCRLKETIRRYGLQPRDSGLTTE